jgi:folate-binding protein YgfZ
LNCHYAPLAQEALLHITGPDALKFLQGQVTCDTRKIDTAHARPGAYCTPQGRVVCDFLLFEVGHEHFALRMRRDIRDSATAVFGKYIIFSKAKLDATREDWIAVAVWGDEAARAVAGIFGEVPSERFGVSRADNAIVVQTDELGHQFECFLHSASSEGRLAQMAARMQCAAEAQWQALQITEGIARIEAAIVEEFVPQILNYDLTGHISFNKGCYTGQEVVARLHYRGKPKRRSYTASLPSVDDCTAGAPVFDAVAGLNVGNIVNCCATAQGALALVAATGGGAQNGLRLGSADGPPITLGVLPYTLEAE